MAVEPKDPGAASAPDPVLASRPIPWSRTLVAAFIGRAERGPVDEPVAVGSFAEYRRVFGGHVDYSFLSHALLHYFVQGGEQALVSRVTNRATRARLVLPAGEQSLTLQAKRPGSHEFLRASIDYDGVEDVPGCFNLVVQQLVSPDSQLVQDQELFPALSIDAADRRYVVGVLKASQLVVPAGPMPERRPDATRANHPGQPIPYIEMTSTGSDGDELTDYDIIGSNRDGTGLFALDRAASFDLLCIPPAPRTELGVTSFLAAARYCERRNALLIWDPPHSWRSAGDALAGVRSLGCASRNAMTYFPRIRRRGDAVRFPAGLPACGALAAALTREPLVRVAAKSGPIAALGAAFTAVGEVDARSRAALKRLGVNTLAAADGRTALHGDVTLAGASAVSGIWQSLSRRRLLFFILSSIERATAWVAECVDSPQAHSALEKQVDVFLRELFDAGALAGRAAQHAFAVRAVPSASTITLHVGVALQRPGELIGYDFRYTRSGVTLHCAAGLDAAQLAG